MAIRKEIKQYSNRRQINLNKGELEEEKEVLILSKSDELQHNKIVANVTTLTGTILKKDDMIAELQKEIRIKDNKINEISASYIEVSSKYNSLIDAVHNTSWIDGLFNRFKNVLENHSKIKHIDTIKAIETTTKDGATYGNDNISDDNVASDDTISQ